MLERSNTWVEVAGVRIPWESRQLLVARLRSLEGTEAIIGAFEDVGTSRPVELDEDGMELLVRVLDFWPTDVTLPELPPGISDLRDALVAGRDDPS